MTLMSEAISRLPEEALKQKQNNFARFIAENKTTFERHANATAELKDEEEAWRNSPEIAKLIEDGIELTLSVSLNGPANAKTLRRIAAIEKERILISIFGSRSEKEDLSKKNKSQRELLSKRVDNKKALMLQSLSDRVDEAETGFQEARAPISIEIHDSQEELFDKFKEFLLSDSSNLFALQDFLSNKNYEPEKRFIRPFLRALAQGEDRLTKENKEGMLTQASKKWISEMRENARPEFIDEFAGLIKSATILSWMKFIDKLEGSRMGFQELNSNGTDIKSKIASMLRGIPDISSWPLELKEAFASFTSSKYFTALAEIKEHLELFRRHTTVNRLMQQELPEWDNRIHKVKAISENSKEARRESDELEALNKMHPIGVLLRELGKPYTVKALSDDALEDVLKRYALSFDSSDPRMLEDLKNLIANLRQTPFGPGTKKLTHMFAVVENRNLPLRSFNSRNRIGCVLSHPESRELRIVYILYGVSDGGSLSQIGIEGIYSHDDYERKFK